MSTLLRLLPVCLFLLSLSLPAAAQVGNCDLGVASATLDANNVRARLYNNGGLFWRGSGNTYTVPKDGTANAIFATGIWFGGKDASDDLRMVGTAYGPWELWPGPIDAATHRPDNPNDCSGHDRIWSFTADDLAAFQHDGTLTDDMATWPAHLGAPFEDANSDGAYDPADGDTPLLKGDQTLWWVMNDAGNQKGWTETAPIGLEVQVLAYAHDTAGPLRNTTFYEFTFLHKGTASAALMGTYFGLWADPDLGDASDDLIGSDPARNMGYVYNGDAFDGGIDGYGDRPPALGYVIHQGPIVGTDTLGLSTFLFYNGDSSPMGNPTGNTDEPYDYLRAIWRDGTPMTYGGTGYNPGSTDFTSHVFPDDPVQGEYWSELNTDGNGSRNTPADRRFLMSSGPFDFAPGDRQVVKLAIVWSQGLNHLQSIEQLRRDVDALQGVLTPPPSAPLAPALASPPNGATEVQNSPYYAWSPNPASPGMSENSSTFYRIQISTDATFPDSTTAEDVITGTGTTIHSLRSKETYFWRVRAENLGGESTWTNAWHFTTGQAENDADDFTGFFAVQNAAGPIPEANQGAAATWWGFPGPQPNEHQQSNGQATFLLHTADNGTRASYDAYINRVTSGGTVGNFGTREIVPYDFEMRFTATGSRAYDPFLTGCYFDVPFELWRIGIDTPDDLSDDVQMVAYVLDDDGTSLYGQEGLPAFNLFSQKTHDDFEAQAGTSPFAQVDHTGSSLDNDPQSDWIYWTTPDDTTPGTAGYEAWQTHMDAEVGVGNCDDGSQYGTLTTDNALRRTVLFQWNAGDVCNDTNSDGTCEAPAYLGNLPETGTVFRITTTTPNHLVYQASFTDLSLPSRTGLSASSTITATIFGSRVMLGGPLPDLSGITDVFLGLGDPGTAGGEIHDLSAARSGTTLADTTLVLSQEALYAGRYFIQVNTTAAPDGAVRAYLLPATNLAPSAATLTSPADASTIRVEGESSTAVPITWDAASDPNGNRLFYRWQLATDEDFTNILLEAFTGTDLHTETDIGTLNQILDDQGVNQEGTLVLYHRVLATDGSLSQASATADLTLSRGVVSADTEDEAALPETFALHGNYPNPFNPTTRIAFDLPHPATVSLQVYDLLGRRVLTLPAQAMTAGSHRTVTVDGSALASGLYLYRLRATTAQQSWQQTGRMVLLK